VTHFRSPELLAIARTQRCTLRLSGCIGGPCVAAHSNQAKHGKGKSIKAHDCFIAFACDPCHRELDQGKNYSRAEKEAAFERAHIESLPILFRAVMREPSARRPTVKACKRSNLSTSKTLPRRN